MVSDLSNVTGENPMLSPLKMKWAVLLISLRTGFSPTNGKPRASTVSGDGTPHSPDMTPRDTPEQCVDDVLLQTPLNSIYEQANHSRLDLILVGLFSSEYSMILCDYKPPK